MPRSMQHDRQLFGVTLALCLIGAVMVFSASAVTAREHYHYGAYFFLRQVLFLGLGCAAMFWLMNVDYRKLRQPQVIFPGLAGVILLLIGVLFLDRSHATHRWMRLGPASLQPSELAKLAVILYLGWFLERRRLPEKFNGSNIVHTLLPALAPVSLMMVLVLMEPDLGTACLIFVTILAMLFIAGISLRYLGYAAVALVPVMYLLIVCFPYRYARILAFWSPEADPQGHGFQLLQSLIAVGSGGLTGVGLMESHQKLFYLPEAHTDFIYAVLCEEMGYIGAVAVVVLFAVYGWRGLRASLRAPDDFGKFLGLGITTMVVAQALINLSVVLGLVPTKGISLPFVSYGGTSLLVMLMATGVLLNISQHAEE